MMFLLYEVERSNGVESLRKLRPIERFGGRGIIWSIWKNKGEPRKLWHISKEELITETTKGGDPNAFKFLIDYNPSQDQQKGLALVEPVQIYVYTYERDGVVEWSVLLLKLKELWNQESDRILSRSDRQRILQKIEDVRYLEGEICEFLYLQGEKKGWNWGMVGRVNAALLYPDAMQEFKKLI